MLDRSSGKELDSFFAKVSYDVMVRPGAYRKIRSTVSSGPQIKTFEFDDAAQPKSPVEKWLEHSAIFIVHHSSG